MSGNPVCPVHGFNVFACIGRSCGPQRFYGDDDVTPHAPPRDHLGSLLERLHASRVRIEGTTQALTSEGCTVCDDIPGLTDHGNGD